MLKVTGIDVFYGDLQVLWDVSFEVREKEILVLVGKYIPRSASSRMNGDSPMRFSKKTANGVEERRELLKSVFGVAHIDLNLAVDDDCDVATDPVPAKVGIQVSASTAGKP